MKKINAVHVSDADTCVTLTGAADIGDTVYYTESGEEKTVVVRGSIPIWHKIAIKPIKKDAYVYKYGAVIGIALEDIDAGDYVHVHNIRSPGA